MKIYKGLALSRYDLKIHVTKLLTETICWCFISVSLTLSLVTTFKIDVQNQNTDSKFGFISLVMT